MEREGRMGGGEGGRAGFGYRRVSLFTCFQKISTDMGWGHPLALTLTICIHALSCRLKSVS